MAEGLYLFVRNILFNDKENLAFSFSNLRWSGLVGGTSPNLINKKARNKVNVNDKYTRSHKIKYKTFFLGFMHKKLSKSVMRLF